MVKYLLTRPIGVFLSFFALIVFSLITLNTLPVSLLPDIEIPSIVIKVNYPNGAPQEIEENVLQTIRENLKTANGIASIESKASNEIGLIELRFEYGTAMSLAYIEVNEKIDRMLDLLPKQLDRPQVIKVNTSDIPILRLHIVPKDPSNYLEISKLTEKVIKKRIEQQQGVSLVDINGLRYKTISIEPIAEKIQALEISYQDIEGTLKQNNANIGGISVKSGQYRYYVKMRTQITTPNDIKKIVIIGKSGNQVRLGDICSISYDEKKKNGYHIYNDRDALVVNIHKQSNAQIIELSERLKTLITKFQNDYSKADFYLTQDQAQLVDVGISNLKSSLLYGGIFAFLILFLFIADIRAAIIIGISLPVSLVISFLFFYFFNLSINIISLSGLALGLGMLIDNAIIVIDNITKKRAQLSLSESCTNGTNEIMSPLVSSVLSTLSVFVPLIFLSGVAGSLFYDQAIAVSIILMVSLGVSFILIPLLYFQLFKHRSNKNLKESPVFLWVMKHYSKLYHKVFKHPKTALLFTFVFMLMSAYIAVNLPKKGFPEVSKNDMLLQIDWSEAISIKENKQRVLSLLSHFQSSIELSESEIGISQYLLSKENPELQQAKIYLSVKQQVNKATLSKDMLSTISDLYPKAVVALDNSPTTFNQVFSSQKPQLEARLKLPNENIPMSIARVNNLLIALAKTEASKGAGLSQSTKVELEINRSKIQQYNIEYQSIKNTLDRIFGDYVITDIKRFGDNTEVVFKDSYQSFEQKLRKEFVSNNEGDYYPLTELVDYKFAEDYKAIYADESWIYQSIVWENPSDMSKITNMVKQLVRDENLLVKFEGLIFENQEVLKELSIVLLISVLLLYFILAAQFESLLQPLIVLFTLPLGIGGSLLLLYLTGSSINIMSLIGIIIMLGIIVNDSILKIDTINMLLADYKKNGITKEILLNQIKTAGKLRLKPILMTSITTILALFPIIFASGIGADLQKPLVYSVVGGLTIGTLLSIYFVPLLYYIFHSFRV